MLCKANAGERRVRLARKKPPPRLRVDGPEVALHPPDLLFEDLVPETGLELALAERRRRDVHRVLAAAQKNLRKESIFVFDMTCRV